MVLSNRDRVGRAFDLLSEGLRDTVDEVMTSSFGGSDWNERWATVKPETSAGHLVSSANKMSRYSCVH